MTLGRTSVGYSGGGGSSGGGFWRATPRTRDEILLCKSSRVSSFEDSALIRSGVEARSASPGPEVAVLASLALRGTGGRCPNVCDGRVV